MCILVVEDEPLIRLILVEELEEAGFAVCEADSGDMAARLIQSPAAPFTLLITDLHMPGKLDGLQVAQMMRQRFPEAPIIYTTGRPDVMDQVGQLRTNDAVLSKPFVPSKLMTVVRHLLETSYET